MVKKNITFFIALFLVNLISIGNKVFIQCIKAWGQSVIADGIVLVQIIAYCSRLLVIVFLVTAVIALVKNHKIRHGIQAIFIVICGVLNVFDIFSLLQYHHLFDNPMLRVILATNSREAAEFLQHYSGSILPILAIVLGMGAVMAALLYLIKKHVGKFSVATVYMGGISVFLTVIFYLLTPIYSSAAQSTMERIVLMDYQVYQEVQIYKQKYQKISSHPVQLTRNDSDIPYVVFILEESTSRKHMGIYGYPLPTTPLLQQRKDKGQLHVFTDTIAPNTHTMAVLESLFTFYRQEAPGDYSDYGDLFGILHEAGYYTNWISNQESSGMAGNVGLLFANRCNEKEFVDIRSNQTQSKFDEAMLPMVERALNENHPKKFVVIQPMGTHFMYSKRYPENYDVFSMSDEVADTDEKKTIRATYDNAVLYEDTIVDSIIHDVEDKNAIVFYISDHADDVFDENQDFCGHWVNGNFRMLEIPMVIWTSDKFKAAHPELENRIARSVDSPFMTDDMIHAILDLLQIETPDYDRTKSVVSDEYNRSRQRVFDGMEYTHGPTPGNKIFKGNE